MTQSVIVTILVLAQCASWIQPRLSIISGSPASVLVRSGERGRLFCQSSAPWLLCVWKGPGGLAVTKTQGQECRAQGARSSEVRVTGRGTRCELEITRVGPEDAGDYSCILADREDVVTVTRTMVLDVGIGARVTWLQGSVYQYVAGDEVSLSCVSSEANPSPNLVIRSDSLSLTEVGREQISADETGTGFVRQSSYSSSLSRTVLVDTSDLTNNTLVSCHAEQRDELSGSLIYNSSVAIIRLEEVLEPLALAECLDWWCEYQIFLFIMLVMVVLIIISCCGMYFFFATRGKPYNVIMYNSEHGTWNRDETVQDVKETLLEKRPENNFNMNNGALGLRADIIRTNDNLNQSLYSQVDMTKKTAKTAVPVPVKPPPPPVLETNFDQLNDDSILQRVSTDFDTTNESSSSLSKDNLNTSFDTSQINANLGDISEEERKRFLLNMTEEEIIFNTSETIQENIYRNRRKGTEKSKPKEPDYSEFGVTEEELKEYEEERKKLLLTMTEEEILMNSTETTLETIYRKYRNKGRSRDTLTEEELHDEFIAETEMRKYALHKYHLANLKNVKRVGRTYSKVVRDHLNNDPKLAVSASSVEFEVARPSSSLSFCNRSNASTPLASRGVTPNPGK